MASSKTMLKLEGFEELYKQIEAAGGKIDQAAERCMRESAQIMQTELKTQMQEKGVKGSLINRMPEPTITKTANTIYAEVGYEKGDFDPKNPSDGYKVVFINYGTPRRTKHGKVKARGFIQKAKEDASKKIKKAQQNTLNTILEELTK